MDQVLGSLLVQTAMFISSLSPFSSRTLFKLDVLIIMPYIILCLLPQSGNTCNLNLV